MPTPVSRPSPSKAPVACSHVDEIINIFGLAIRHQLRASDLSHMAYAYPTGASDISYML